MEVVVSNAEARHGLGRYLRSRGYLVVVDRRVATVQVHPLNCVSERHDRAVLERDLHKWRTDNPDITVELH